VINADSMQVYDTLHVLTARPFEADMGGVPHHLYGHGPGCDSTIRPVNGCGTSVAVLEIFGRERKGACRFSLAAPGSISRR
jgi:hypothetical protein